MDGLYRFAPAPAWNEGSTIKPPWIGAVIRGSLAEPVRIAAIRISSLMTARSFLTKIGKQ
jgi:hypothetical protein